MAPHQTDADEETPRRGPGEAGRDPDPTSDHGSEKPDELDPDADPDNIEQGEQDVRPPEDS